MTRTLTCPTCGSESKLLVNDQCPECADEETAELFERLQPE